MVSGKGSNGYLGECSGTTPDYKSSTLMRHGEVRLGNNGIPDPECGTYRMYYTQSIQKI